jgi:succinyl-CoA synthetase alpha subunit
MFGRGKHGCPVVLAAGGRGPIPVVSLSGTGVNQGSNRIHRGQFGQNHEIGEGAHPGEDVGVDGTAGAATGNTCQRVQWS